MAEQIDWTRPLPSSGVRVLLDVAATFDVPDDVVLDGVGLQRSDLVDERTVVTGLQEVEALRNLQAARPRVEHLGLLAAQRQPITNVGALGFAYMTAPDWLQPMELNRRFIALTWSMVDFTYEHVGDRFEFEYLPGSLPADVVGYYLQRDMGAAVHLGRQNLIVHEVTGAFPWQAPADPAALAEYVKLFGDVPEFGASRALLRADAADLLSPHPLSSPGPHARFIEEAEEELRQYESMSGMRGRVRHQIMERLEDGVTLEEVASTLLVSGRTLRRQLALEDTTFRELLEEVRRDRASELLKDQQLGIAQISHRLGYENASAFTVAFRRWHGRSPTDFRRQLT